jgi:uncharacterized protein (TIGR03032 family)
MTDSPSADDSTPQDEPAPKLREVRYRHSPSFVAVLQELQSTLLVSTYQAGKLGAISAVDGRLHFSFHNFDQAMGVAIAERRIAVGAKGQIWMLDDNRQLAPSMAPPGRYDGCYLARTAHVTGGIHCHEMAFAGDGSPADELWVVNTLFSCLSTLHPEYSFVPRWRPPFISELAGQDRCHLNGLAMDGGRPQFVTVMSETDEPAGWRAKKETTGCVLDVASGAVVTRGLAMPHSPRWKHGRLWVLNSGFGAIETVDLATGRREAVAAMPGYTRGLAFCGPYAFVGLSRIRETAVFGGVPIAEHRSELKCGVGVVDLRSGQPVASLEFETGVEEIFDVQVLAGRRCVALCGPRPDMDDAQDVWLVPRPDQTERIVASARQLGQLRDPAAAVSSPPPATDGGTTTATAAEVRQWVEMALALQRDRRVGEAIELFQRAASARPQSAEIWNHLGNALQDAGRQEQALECYRQAVQAEPTFGPGLQNLGYVLVAQGRTDEGVARLSEAQRVAPTPVNHVLIATALPVIYESLADLQRRRQRLESEVQRLADEGVRVDATSSLVPTNFFAAYQGLDDRPLHANLGRIYQGVDATPLKRSDASRNRIRVGLLSAYFRDHTIGRLNVGRVERLPRDRFEVVVLSVGDHRDELAERFRRAADRFVPIPRNVATARQLIADEQLDLLLFTDVGMDALTYTLAFSRMAPVQAATWGHPVTTGSPTMDWFLSSELLETDEAREHYTERLLTPGTLGTYYYRPRLEGPAPSRRDLGLDDDRTLYLCPQTLFKFHPEFDEVLAGILRRDPRGQLALIEGRTANWTQQLKGRFERVMPDVTARIRWLPALPNRDFLHVLAGADVMLDPLHFGGGNTSYEALLAGTPIVTLPGEFLRSRITRALYAKMDWLDLVAETKDEYADLAVRLGTDTDYRKECRRTIAERAEVLYEDGREIDDLAASLETMVDRDRLGK